MDNKEGRGVMYVQPADPKDLERVIREGQVSLGADLQAQRSAPRWRFFIIWINVAVVSLLAVGAVVWKVRRARVP